jgi:predicted Zn-dependent protease
MSQLGIEKDLAVHPADGACAETSTAAEAAAIKRRMAVVLGSLAAGEIFASHVATPTNGTYRGH